MHSLAEFTYFVTGATGFLGGRLVEALLARGASVVAHGRNGAAGEKLERAGAKFVRGSLNDLDHLRTSVPENSRIIHCAALCSSWGKYGDFHASNVEATQNLIKVALEKSAGGLVHVSTPSIYVEKRDRLGVKESDPLPKRMINHYAATKLLAEEEVLKAVKASGLRAVILRPQGIFGPGDRALMPRVLRLARRGILPVIGNGKNQIDLTYVDNVVEAIVCADRAGDVAIGKIYNITNGEPVELVSALRSVVEKLGLTVREKRLPLALAWPAASVLEALYRIFSLRGEPVLTRYSICALGLTRTLDISAARRDLQYSPRIGVEEGIRRYIEWYRQSGS